MLRLELLNVKADLERESRGGSHLGGFASPAPRDRFFEAAERSGTAFRAPGRRLAGTVSPPSLPNM
jgi:hypothetical protein